MFAKWLYIQNGHAMTHAVPCLSTWRTRFNPIPVHGNGLNDTGTGLPLSAVISYPILGLGRVIKLCCMKVCCSVLLWEKEDHVNVDVYWMLLLKNTFLFVYQTFIHCLGSWCCQLPQLLSELSPVFIYVHLHFSAFGTLFSHTRHVHKITIHT